MTSQERIKLSSRPGVHRRQTLSSIPAARSTDGDERAEQRQRQNSDNWKKRSRGHAATSSSSSSSGPAESQDSDTSTRGHRLWARLGGDGHYTAHVSHSSTSGADTRGPSRRLGRTPSSPSVLFSKVKERIREKVSKQRSHYIFVFDVNVLETD